MTESGPQHSFTGKANPESAEEALQRAAGHARRACAEALEAVRALLDAASLGLTGQTAEKHAAFAMFSQFLADLSDRIAVKETDIVPLILDALGHEISRWEARSKDDPEARSVLRAFLGLREIIWEFGVQGSGKTDESSERERGPQRQSTENSE